MKEFQIPKKNWVTRRFVFKNTKIIHLKAKIASSDGQSPSRVEFIAALLYKCAINTEKSKLGSFSPSILWLPVNMRREIVPQLPQTTIGNWIWVRNIRTTTESESSLNALIDRIKKRKMQITGRGSRKRMKDLDEKEFRSQILEPEESNYRSYFCSSTCNLEFYKVNFGWGKPVQVALGDAPLQNSLMLSDTPSGDGIEALVSSEEQEMFKIQLDQELDALA